MLCGGSAWPAGFAHAQRAKSAGPPAHPPARLLLQTWPEEAPLLCAERTAGRAAPVAQPQRVPSGCARGLSRGGACSRGVWRVGPCMQPQRVVLRRALSRVWPVARRRLRWDMQGAVGPCVRSRRVAIGHAPIRAACVTVVRRVAVRDAVCAEACGLWHRRIADSCAGRGGGGPCVQSQCVASRAVHATAASGATACAESCVACGAAPSQVGYAGRGGAVRAVEACGATACAESCGLWHRRGAGSCVGRGEERYAHGLPRGVRVGAVGMGVAWPVARWGVCVGRGQNGAPASAAGAPSLLSYDAAACSGAVSLPAPRRSHRAV